jgi:spore germination protein YaaH
MLKKLLLFFLIIAFVSTAVVIGTMYFKVVDPYEFVKAFKRGRTNIVIEDKPIYTVNHPIILEDKTLLPIDVIREYIYSDVELDEDHGRVYINVQQPEFKLENDSLDKRIENGIDLNFLAEKIEGAYYLNIDGLEKILGIKANYIIDTDILIIDKMKNNETIGILKENAYLRPKKSIFSFGLDKLMSGEKVVIFDKEKDWFKVRTQEGFIGYISSKSLYITTEECTVNTKLNNTRDDWQKPGNISLVWDHIVKYSPDLSKEEAIEGLDIISPTWFSIVSSDGYVINNGDMKYIMDAHDKGYKVWALINNSFDKDLTKELLASDEAQERAINQILVYSSIYNLDGINIDFENVYYEDKDRLTAFIGKLTGALKEQNLIVSMDMTVPSMSRNWSMFYDREKLGQIVDYCIVMTYDEHWASSPVSGSVASIGWVERGIEKTLKYIPNEKLLMGVPFYTRRWEETVEKGKVKVKSKALSMEQVNKIIEENDSEVIWLDDTGQYYTEYTKDGKRYRIWIEDEKSIQLKAELVNKYNLAGVAAWRKGFEKTEVWAALNSVIKNTDELIVEKD